MEDKSNIEQSASEKEIEPFKQLITEIIAPEHRDKINIIADHVTALHPTKQKKVKGPKKKKRLNLTRKEFANLGLYNLPKEGLKYDDFLPLHELWKGYMSENLSLNTNEFKIPEVYDPGYEAFSKHLMKSDLHGAIITVSKSKCPNFVGQSGIIILETKNVLKIISKDNKLRTLPKADSIFKILIDKVEITIFGKHLTIRPAEKSVKKIKNFIQLDL